jgi:hypothetical protein
MFNVDVSRFSYPETIQWIVPVLPGGVLVTGILLTENHIASAFYSKPEITSGAKIAIVLFAVYVSGFILSSIVSIVEYTLGYWLGLWLGKKRSPTFMQSFAEPHKNKAWRRAARKLIGDDLAPQIEDSYDPILHDMEQRHAETIQDPTEQMKANLEIGLRHLRIQLADGIGGIAF